MNHDGDTWGAGKLQVARYLLPSQPETNAGDPGNPKPAMGVDPWRYTFIKPCPWCLSYAASLTRRDDTWDLGIRYTDSCVGVTQPMAMVFRRHIVIQAFRTRFRSKSGRIQLRAVGPCGGGKDWEERPREIGQTEPLFYCDGRQFKATDTSACVAQHGSCRSTRSYMKAKVRWTWLTSVPFGPLGGFPMLDEAQGRGECVRVINNQNRRVTNEAVRIEMRLELLGGLS